MEMLSGFRRSLGQSESHIRHHFANLFALHDTILK
jgi:hypothetical protein